MLDRFVLFCAEKGFKINPDKSKAMASCTLAYAESGLRLPTFNIAGMDLDYVKLANT